MGTFSVDALPNLSPSSYSANKTYSETSAPNPPTGASNSAPQTQEDGSSLPKQAQGILEKTTTDLNNLIPAHGCSVKLPAQFDKIQIKLKQMMETESNRLKEFATWLGGSVAPIVEQVKQAIKAIKDRMKEIQKYIDEIKKVVEEIKEWIQVVQEFITFVMSLPAKLMQLVQNCMDALQSSLSTMISDAATAAKEAASANTASAQQVNATPTT